MKDMIKLRYSLAIPSGMLICTKASFIVHVGLLKDGLPNREFELVHVSEADRHQIEAAALRAA